MFTLVELNKDNYNELAKLEISEAQKPWVLDFKGCIEYKKENPFLKIYGIKLDEKYIGLTAFARWDSNLEVPVEKRSTWFDEFFLDVRYQGKGYAREIVRLILDKIISLYNPKIITLSVRNENEVAKNLYRKIGFKDSNLVYDPVNDDIIKKEVIGSHDEMMMFLDVNEYLKRV